MKLIAWYNPELCVCITDKEKQQWLELHPPRVKGFTVALYAYTEDLDNG